MKLEVGKHYLNASGEIVKIVDAQHNSHFKIKDFYYYDCSENAYFYDGKCAGDIREYDLISEVPKELHFEIIRVTKEYHTNSEFKKVVDNSYKTHLIVNSVEFEKVKV